LESLLLSLAPKEYSSASPADTGGFNFISPARQQRNCASCVGFAATAAAEAAMAVEQQKGWLSSGNLSVANISFCGGWVEHLAGHSH
jgi:C1A family cysteine protease